jgi:TP901 family phage tail tape measure protein
VSNRVSYTFSLSDKYSRQAKKVTKATKAFRLSMVGLSKAASTTGRVVAGSFKLMKGAAVGLQSSMAPLLAGLAGVAGVLKFFSLGVGFEDAMLDLQSITGATGKDLEFLKESALSMGKEAKIGAAETAKAFELVASAKPELLKNTEALAATTKQVLLLSNASGLDLATSAETVGETLNQFGLEAGEAARLVNVLAAGAKLGSSLVPQTGRALREVGGIAKEAGVSLETTNAAIQLLALGGIKGTKAGTQLKGALLGLAASGIEKITPSIVGMEQALKNLKAMNLSETQQIKLFGRENLQTGQVLTRTSDRLATLTREMTGTYIATEQANIRMSGMSSRLRGLGVTIGNSVIRAFERLAPVFEEVIKDMEKFFDSISSEDVKTFANNLKPVVSGMVELGRAAATVAEFAGPVLRLMGASASGLKDLFTLATGGELTAANSASFKNATRLEKQQTDINVGITAPAGVVNSVKSSTSGKASGLNTGVNLRETG